LDERGLPLIGGVGEEAVLAVRDDLAVHPDGRADDGQPACHVLDELVPAFAARPGVVDDGHDADVHGLKV